MTPDVAPVAIRAQEFLDSLPEGFEGRYPTIVKQLRGLVGKEGEPTVPPTFGQLHMLRSMIRQDIDYHDLTPSMREGVLRQLDQSITGVLFDEEAPPQLQAAAHLLRQADAFYAKNMPKFKAQSLRWTRQQMETGVPVDAAELAAKYFQPGQGEEIAMTRKVVGKPLWTAVQAADTQRMLDTARTLVPGEIDGQRFAAQVLDRERNGILASAYDAKIGRHLARAGGAGDARQRQAADGRARGRYAGCADAPGRRTQRRSRPPRQVRSGQLASARKWDSSIRAWRAFGARRPRPTGKARSTS